ncbi:MAG TPA: succinylglutamate desuccinylase/aspartoacylase family protein [Syntrophomonas sp.]|nr:succinylglutamate desuccinylase/aspartoacylase family protein [Syntrophomonas sp.]
MTETIQIGTAAAKPGERARGKLFVGELANGSEVAIPVMIANGKNPGPVLWLNAALHGNEFNGVIVSRRVAAEVDVDQLNGAIVCTPVSNPTAFQGKQRLSLFDELNLGECYPGQKNGQMTERVAFTHFQELKKYANYLIDYHASGVTHLAAPYSVYKTCDKTGIEAETERLVKAFGLYLNCKINTTQSLDEPHPLGGSLDLQCILNNIPAFMVEIGNSGRLEDDIIEASVQSTYNVMKYLKMVPGSPEIKDNQKIVQKRYIVRCNNSGIVLQETKPYDYVKKGARIARIVNLFGDVLEEVIAEEDCYMISLRYDAVVNAGDRVAFVGIAPQAAENTIGE